MASMAQEGKGGSRRIASPAGLQRSTRSKPPSNARADARCDSVAFLKDRFLGST